MCLRRGGAIRRRVSEPRPERQAARPVDRALAPVHRPSVSKKTPKVEEPHTAYRTKPAKAASAGSSAGPRYADLNKVRAGNAKLLKVHATVLQKLAQ